AHRPARRTWIGDDRRRCRGRGRRPARASGRSDRSSRACRQAALSGDIRGRDLLSRQSLLRNHAMLVRRTPEQARRNAPTGPAPPAPAAIRSSEIDRRSFLRRSGLAAGALTALGTLPLAAIRKAEAGPPPVPGTAVERRKSICTHCSVGCTVTAEVQNGLWIGQEPSWDSPINRGSHCSKGASVRELVRGERRLKYPLKLVDGQWVRVSWSDAIEAIGNKLLEIRAKSGPETTYWLGSAKFSNETAYLFRKFAAFWGTNNADHQARICHSTTVAGVANTW